MKFAAATLAVIVAATTSAFAAETRLSIEGPSGALQGTLAAPEGGPKTPVAIIIPGSGPTDRDGNSPLGITAGKYCPLAGAPPAESGAAHPHHQRRPFCRRAAGAA